MTNDSIASAPVERSAPLDVRSIPRGAIELLVVAVLYFAAAKASLTIASIHPSASPIWPPTGIALAAVMLCGYRVCPAIFVAAFLANVTTAGSVFTSVAVAAGNTLESIVGGYLTRHWSGDLQTFDTAGGVTRFTLISLVCATPISAVIGVGSLTLTGYAPLPEFGSIWMTWWLGDCAGALVITPVIVLWAVNRVRLFNCQELLGIGSAIAAATAVGLIAFSPLSDPLVNRSALGFLTVLPLTWVALRRGPRDTATVALILSCFAVWGMVSGSRPFGRAAELNDSFLLLVTFMISTSVPSLALSADVALRKRTEEALRQAHEKMEQTIQERTAALDQTRQELFQVQKTEAVGQLTSGIAHDFNNLLTAILGSLELVMKYVNDAKGVRLVTAATEAAQHGASLTAQLLSFSRKRDVALRPINVNDVIRSTQDMLQRMVGPLVRISYDLEDDAWPATGNADQLKASLLNLIANGRDAMPRGGELVVRTRRLAGGRSDSRIPDVQPSDYMEVSVSDTGSGMSEEVRSRAFDPFFTTKGPGKGSGLGLAMVYGFAKQTGGTAAITSTPGKSTTVSIFLPRTEGVWQVHEKQDTRAAAPGGKRQVLLVDDDESVRASIKEMLEQMGHEITDAGSGETALDILEKDAQFDLVLIDFAMPGMNGSELASAIKNDNPELPILFMTGYVDNEILRQWSAIGYRTLNKPFGSAELAAAIRETR